MTAVPSPRSAPQGYWPRLSHLTSEGLMQVVRPASHSRRAEAARAWARLTLLVTVAASVIIVGLMYGLDATEITWMPARGTAALWPLRIMTDFGKSAYVIWTLFAAMIALLLLAPRVIGVAHATLIGLAARLQYLFFAVGLANLVGEVLKGTIGRGRPFVGGAPNAFNFSHFSWSEAYASFPSGHATTSCALAFAVAAVWPRSALVMIGYAIVIILTRLVLLAHHPSDVTAGALLGITSAMVVRYWFAARSVVFRINADGSLVARQSASPAATLRALRRALSPGAGR